MKSEATTDYGKLVYVRVSPDGRYLQMTDPTTYQGCDLLIQDQRGWRTQVKAFVMSKTFDEPTNPELPQGCGNPSCKSCYSPGGELRGDKRCAAVMREAQKKVEEGARNG